MKIIFTFGILFVARPCNAINDILVTALPSALYIFNLKGEEREEESFIQFFPIRTLILV